MSARVARWRILAAAVGVGTLVACAPATAQDAPPVDAVSALPKALRGPFISDPEVVVRLDHLDPGGDCAKSGKLVFACLIQVLAEKNNQQAPAGPQSNPLNLKVAAQIKTRIERDLSELAKGSEDGERSALNDKFFTHASSRIELVGIINRIDRQFIKDTVPGSEDHGRCGEISVIYRFSYALKTGEAHSRLPVTMNVVFPAVPRSKPKGASNCQEIAARWVAFLGRPADRSADEIVKGVTDPESGVLSTIAGADIERIELNMQAYRIKAGNDKTDFGSTAEYVIRVFRWDPGEKSFMPSYLTNQIDRARLLGKPDANSCEKKPPPGDWSLAALQTYLTSAVVLSDIDNGTLNIPDGFLACRATTVSPGAAHRSKNQPFWNDPKGVQQILSDPQILKALKAAISPTRQFSFMKTADDVRSRLNELTCSGCHQARAIAGFHFPGSDRKGAPSTNAVLLPGSPHFYGDQPRRLEILLRLAAGETLKRYDLAASYAARPLNKLKVRPELEQELADKTELLGGWGGTCLMTGTVSQRQWDCKAGLVCAPLFKSKNAPGVGTCVPKSGKPDGDPPDKLTGTQIGDAMQLGTVTTESYGVDTYLRTYPTPETPPAWCGRPEKDPACKRKLRRTLIPDERLPPIPPEDNTYYSAHQEYFEGDDSDDNPPNFVNKRNALTGGFPSGMLRLSECRNLPPEATCGLLAASGFTDCLKEVGGKRTLAECFVKKTSYSGVRACDAAHPCRDDYICLQPIGYAAKADKARGIKNGKLAFEEREKNVAGEQHKKDFGQQRPDDKWLDRNDGRGDQRGLCIPPYFVFQFRSDGHPDPSKP